MKAETIQRIQNIIDVHYVFESSDTTAAEAIYKAMFEDTVQITGPEKIEMKIVDLPPMSEPTGTLDQVANIIRNGYKGNMTYVQIAEDIWQHLFLKPKPKPIADILKNRKDLKKLFALYVDEDYDAVPFAMFKKGLENEGFDDMMSVARIVKGIEKLGYTLNKDEQ